MTDFGGYRSMLLDFGCDPRAVDTMSLSSIVDMMVAMEKRRGKTEVPDEQEREKKFSVFMDQVKNDPSVRFH